MRQIDGSVAVAEAVAACRPEVVSAYPITPQAHIVEALWSMVRSGRLSPCELINAESQFSAMSVAIGASAAGARAYTATASQGLLSMAEAIYNAAGLGLPVVMTLANRAIGAPVNIWNDHSDAMAVRDAGWVQLFAEDNQAAADLHVQAFRVAEDLSVPVMVCMDGFVLTHAFEAVEVPGQGQVDEFLPPYEPRQVLDPAEPVSVGAMVGPEAFEEVRYLEHVKLMSALEKIPQVAEEFYQSFGRYAGGLVAPYRADDAHTVVVAMGSLLGTLKDIADDLRQKGHKVGVLGITTFRPFPAAAVREALWGARVVIVVEKAFSTGFGGVLSTDVATAMGPLRAPIATVVAGLGGRPVSATSLARIIEGSERGYLERVTFLDLDQDLVDRELARAGAPTRQGASSASVLRDVAPGSFGGEV
ncbi:MAG: transketolase C-terminal domain-containing protein [Acidimicrobiales bacterium]